ncbi:MAG: hypothetical protein PVS3B2_20650 [Candidatus Dormibacteraceae bacterium]
MTVAICCSVASKMGIAELMAFAMSSTVTASRLFFSCLVATLRFPPVCRCDPVSPDIAHDILFAGYEFHLACSD